MPTILDSVPCQSSHPQLFVTTPSLHGSHPCPSENALVVQSPALARPALSCPSSSLCVSPMTQDRALSWARLRAGPSAHAASSALLLHPTPPSRAGVPDCRHPRSEGRAWSPPREWGTVWQPAGRYSPAWQPLVNRSRAWWGWLLPEARTGHSIIKATRHLPWGELQAGLDIWAEVGELKSKDCPPFWL